MNKTGLEYLRYRLEIAKECEADSVKIDIEELASALGEVDRIRNDVINEYTNKLEELIKHGIFVSRNDLFEDIQYIAEQIKGGAENE